MNSYINSLFVKGHNSFKDIMGWSYFPFIYKWFDFRQEAIQAAISEKDANIALLEMTSSKKQRNTEDISRLEKEKEKLALQLKELVSLSF